MAFILGLALPSKGPDVCVCPTVPGGHSFHGPRAPMISPYEKRSSGYPNRNTWSLSQFGTVSCHTFKTRASCSMWHSPLSPLSFSPPWIFQGRRAVSCCPVGRCHHRQAPGVSRVERTLIKGPDPTGGIRSKEFPSPGIRPHPLHLPRPDAPH